MPELTIISDDCKKCGLCVESCACAVFEQAEKGTVPEIVKLDRCISCGHCAAICPQGAVRHSDFPEEAVTPLKSDRIPDYDGLMELIRLRRSKREFKDKEVEQEVLEKVLDAARLAPTGHNAQNIEYAVVRDPQALKDIGMLTADGLIKNAKPFTNPIGRLIMRFILGKRTVTKLAAFMPELMALGIRYKEGRDLILNEAPALILFATDKTEGFMGCINANLALQNAALAIETVGLGCFYTGFVAFACERSDAIAKRVGLPETHKVFGGLAVGYPKLNYKKWPERKPAKITWV